MNLHQQNLDKAHKLMTQAAEEIEALCQLPEYEAFAKEVTEKTSISVDDVLGRLKHLLVIVNIQRF